MPIIYTLWHTTNAIYWYSVKKLVTLARLFTKLSYMLSYELQKLTMIKMSPFANSRRHIPVCINLHISILCYEGNNPLHTWYIKNQGKTVHFLVHYRYRNLDKKKVGDVWEIILLRLPVKKTNLTHSVPARNINFSLSERESLNLPASLLWK